MRWLALAVLAACGASVDSGTTVDASDQPPIDAPDDAGITIDARPCTGGDQSTTAPDGSCFLLFTTPRTYADAKATCQAEAARLALLVTAALDTVAEDFVGTLDTWIGLDDLVSEGTFVWNDGAPLQFANWHAGEPNNGGGAYEEDCVVIAGARVGKGWDDRPCAPDPTVGGGLYATLCQF
jgi:hypothetical protein